MLKKEGHERDEEDRSAEIPKMSTIGIYTWSPDVGGYRPSRPPGYCEGSLLVAQ